MLADGGYLRKRGLSLSALSAIRLIAGGMSRMTWGVSFGLLAVLMLLALVAFRLMRRKEISVDRGASS